jgi:hypothetical protein
MKKGIVLKPNGELHIVHPTPEALAKGRTYEEIMERAISPGDTYHLVNEQSMPTDRYFRDAWEFSNNKITTNKTKAASIKMDHIRHARDAELIDQDLIQNQVRETIETYQFAIEDLDEEIKSLDLEIAAETDEIQKAALSQTMSEKIAARRTLVETMKTSKTELKGIMDLKQKLRDIPQTTALTTMTLDRIKHYVPAELAHRDDLV